jgi:hypothetical protein
MSYGRFFTASYRAPNDEAIREYFKKTGVTLTDPPSKSFAPIVIEVESEEEALYVQKIFDCYGYNSKDYSIQVAKDSDTVSVSSIASTVS